MNRRKLMVTSLGCIWATVALSADTIVLRDGRRVSGTLLAVRDGIIEFEGQRGGVFSGRERLRIDRADVIRIEFDDERVDRGGDTFGNRRDDRRDDRLDDRRDDRRDDSRDGGRPSGLRERDVRVNARDAWTDTGVTVRPGQTIYINATGRVRWGPGRQDGPAGERNSPRNDGRPIPSRPAAALIGRVGDGSDYFFIGDSPDGIRVRNGGTLYLGLNDDFLEDNSGALAVTVFY